MWATSSLEQLHEVGLVVVCLIELDHRELGVVAGGTGPRWEPLPISNTRSNRRPQPLEVSSVANAQVGSRSEGVVVGDEGRHGLRRVWVEDRRLHLDEPRGPPSVAANEMLVKPYPGT